VRSTLSTFAAVVLLSTSMAGQEQARITMPVVVHQVQPQYTESAIRHRIQGSVTLRVVVRADGTVGDITVTKSLDPELDQQAIAAAKQWTFKPGTRDGQPVNVSVALEMTFTLRGAPKTAERAQSQVYKPGKDGVKSPVLIKEVKPEYTEDAKSRGVQGRVEVSAVVKADGTVGDVTVTKSLDPDLDQQAVSATKQWRFRPGTKDDKPVDVEVSIELTFTLK